MRRGVFLLVLLLVACRAQPAPKGPPQLSAADPGPVRPPGDMAYDFQWRQRVTAYWPESSRSFDAVLQKRDGELLLLGLSPMGLPGFILRLRADGDIDFDNRTQHELPFPPAFILADVQKVFFEWLPRPAPDFTGERTGTRAGLHVVEAYEQGRLLERRFARTTSPGEVHVVYGDWRSDERAARRVQLNNGWFGYRLTIETLEQTGI